MPSRNSRPTSCLLAGGTDGGNTEVVLYNAKMLAKSAIDAPIVYAGNRVAADDARDILAKQSLTVAENVMPELGMLATDSAREAIRNIFIARIVHAKGIDRAQEMFDDVLMPTPAAVMEGARLLSDGDGHECGLGELLVVDPGRRDDRRPFNCERRIEQRCDSEGHARTACQAHRRR